MRLRKPPIFCTFDTILVQFYCPNKLVHLWHLNHMSIRQHGKMLTHFSPLQSPRIASLYSTLFLMEVWLTRLIAIIKLQNIKSQLPEQAKHLNNQVMSSQASPKPIQQVPYFMNLIYCLISGMFYESSLPNLPSLRQFSDMEKSSNYTNRKMWYWLFMPVATVKAHLLYPLKENNDVTVKAEHYEQRPKMRQLLPIEKFFEVQTFSSDVEGHELSFLFSSQQLITIGLINSYNQIIERMSFFYFFQTQANGLALLQEIYYVPSQCHQSAANLILVKPTNPSQMEQKQNSILQANIPTRDSLPIEIEESTKAAKKKKIAKKEKDESFGCRNQNKDRNILSNILKAFVNFLLENEGMKNYLQSLISKLNFQNGVSAFHTLLEQKLPRKSYISPKQLKTFLKGSSEAETFALILRLALKRFLKVDYYIILLKSTKIKRRSKMDQMKKCRELLALLFRH